MIVAPPEQQLETGGLTRTYDLARFVSRYRDRAGDARFRFDIRANRLFVFVEKVPLDVSRPSRACGSSTISRRPIACRGSGRAWRGSRRSSVTTTDAPIPACRSNTTMRCCASIESICDVNPGRPRRALPSEMARSPAASPLRLAIYYGYPSLVNGAAGRPDASAAHFAEYDVLVLGDGLEFGGREGHAEHAFTRALIEQAPHGRRAVPRCTATSTSAARSGCRRRTIVDRIDRWARHGRARACCSTRPATTSA